MQWQPIETAPKDGTEVIIVHYTADGVMRLTVEGPFTASFCDNRWRSSWDGEEVVEYMDWGGTDYKVIMSPTHWMHLPEPPKGEF